MGPRKKASQADIAKLAGVSQTAVSLVVNGRADEYKLSADSQARVLRAMEQLNYTPNVAARALRNGRNGMVGVHTYEAVFPVNDENYYHEFLAGIEEQAAVSGVDLVLFASTQQPDGTRSILARGGNRLQLTDGTIVVGMERNDAELLPLVRDGYAFVFIGRRDLPGVDVPWVSADYASGVRDLVAHVADRGHREVCYLAHEGQRGPQQERRQAFRAAADAADVTVEFIAGEHQSVTPVWLGQLISRGTTLLVAESHVEATQVHLAAEAAGLAIPDALSTVCLDAPPPTAPVARWTHLRVPRKEMGRRSLAILVGVIEGRFARDHHEVLPCLPPTEFGTVRAA